jgi:hypothetical protein
MRALLLFMLPAVAATALVLSCGETEEDPPDGAELSLTPEVTTAATPAASPEPAPTLAAEPAPAPGPIPSDWKEYRDEGLGFSLRYPPDLEFGYVTGPSPVGGQLALQFSSPDNNVRSFSIAIVHRPEGITLREFVHGAGGCLPETIEESVVGGVRAILCTVQYSELAQAPAVAFEHSGMVLFITSRMPVFGYEAEFDLVVQSIEL